MCGHNRMRRHQYICMKTLVRDSSILRLFSLSIRMSNRCLQTAVTRMPFNFIPPMSLSPVILYPHVITHCLHLKDPTRPSLSKVHIDTNCPISVSYFLANVILILWSGDIWWSANVSLAAIACGSVSYSTNAMSFFVGIIRTSLKPGYLRKSWWGDGWIPID